MQGCLGCVHADVLKKQCAHSVLICVPMHCTVEGRSTVTICHSNNSFLLEMGGCLSGLGMTVTPPTLHEVILQENTLHRIENVHPAHNTPNASVPVFSLKIDVSFNGRWNNTSLALFRRRWDGIHSHIASKDRCWKFTRSGNRARRILAARANEVGNGEEHNHKQCTQRIQHVVQNGMPLPHVQEQ